MPTPEFLLWIFLVLLFWGLAVLFGIAASNTGFSVLHGWHYGLAALNCFLIGATWLVRAVRARLRCRGHSGIALDPVTKDDNAH